MASKNVIKLSGGLKELRLHLCQKSTASAGARQFVETHYVPIKMSNPKFPILVSQVFFAYVAITNKSICWILEFRVSEGVLEIRKKYFLFRRKIFEYFRGKLQFSPQNCKKKPDFSVEVRIFVQDLSFSCIK